MKSGTHFRKDGKEWMWVSPAPRLRHSGMIRDVDDDPTRSFAVCITTGEVTIMSASDLTSPPETVVISVRIEGDDGHGDPLGDTSFTRTVVFDRQKHMFRYFRTMFGSMESDREVRFSVVGHDRYLMVKFSSGTCWEINMRRLECAIEALLDFNTTKNATKRMNSTDGFKIKEVTK